MDLISINAWKGNEMMKDKFKILKEEIISLLKMFVFWFGLFFLITQFLVNPIQVIGNSMHPTLLDEERGFSSVISKHFDIERFDIVVVEAENKDFWVKRVMGCPNDTIEMRNDVLFINGEEVSQDFLDIRYVAEEIEKYGYFTEDFGPITLKEDEYFLMGDNRHHSTDSRVVGPFKKDQISSVGVFVYYPFSQIGVK